MPLRELDQDPQADLTPVEEIKVVTMMLQQNWVNGTGVIYTTDVVTQRKCQVHIEYIFYFRSSRSEMSQFCKGKAT